MSLYQLVGGHAVGGTDIAGDFFVRHQSKTQKQTPPPHGGASSLKIAVAYDGFSDLIRVSEMWARLAMRQSGATKVDSAAWNFSSLRDPNLGAEAAAQTAQANMIVLSFSGRGGPPEHMKNWIDSWLPLKKRRGDAIVVMLDVESPLGEAARMFRDQLKRLARRSGMTFFCNHRRPAQVDGAAV